MENFCSTISRIPFPRTNLTFSRKDWKRFQLISVLFHGPCSMFYVPCSTTDLVQLFHSARSGKKKSSRLTRGIKYSPREVTRVSKSISKTFTTRHVSLHTAKYGCSYIVFNRFSARPVNVNSLYRYSFIVRFSNKWTVKPSGSLTD